MTRLYVIYAEYSVGVTLLLLFVSCFVRAIDENVKVPTKKYYIMAIILLFFACAIGTQGIQMITIPVIGALALNFLGTTQKAFRNEGSRLPL